MDCSETKKYVMYVLRKYIHIQESSVQIRNTSSQGYSCNWWGTTSFCIYIPEKVKDTECGAKLPLRHEAGHLVLAYLVWTNPSIIQDELNRIKAHRIICKFLRWKYWGKIPRKLLQWMGYASDLNDRHPDDMMFSGFCTRSDMELFCDWFAIFSIKRI